jgi:hypothetical protein
MSHPLCRFCYVERNEPVVIRCAGGITARLAGLEQGSTYAGLLDGGPTHEINEMLLDRVANEEGGDIPTRLVRPAEKRVVSTSGYHDLMLLPRFKCRGFFESGPFKLWIVWFQDTDAPPISPAVKAELLTLDFRANAREELDES